MKINIGLRDIERLTESVVQLYTSRTTESISADHVFIGCSNISRIVITRAFSKTNAIADTYLYTESECYWGLFTVPQIHEMPSPALLVVKAS